MPEISETATASPARGKITASALIHATKVQRTFSM
jgi:hypothetical protein